MSKEIHLNHRPPDTEEDHNRVFQRMILAWIQEAREELIKMREKPKRGPKYSDHLYAP